MLIYFSLYRNSFSQGIFYAEDFIQTKKNQSLNGRRKNE
jgi:hypothetical protein